MLRLFIHNVYVTWVFVARIYPTFINSTFYILNVQKKLLNKWWNCTRLVCIYQPKEWRLHIILRAICTDIITQFLWKEFHFIYYCVMKEGRTKREHFNFLAVICLFLSLISVCALIRFTKISKFYASSRS